MPYFKITPKSKQVLTNEDDLKFEVEFEITDDTPVTVHFSIMDDKRGGSILSSGAKPISGKGRHKLSLI